MIESVPQHSVSLSTFFGVMSNLVCLNNVVKKILHFLTVTSVDASNTPLSIFDEASSYQDA